MGACLVMTLSWNNALHCLDATAGLVMFRLNLSDAVSPRHRV